MIIGWTYLGSSSFILSTLNLKWLVTKISEEIFSHYISMLTSQGQKGESSCYLLKVFALGQKLVLRKPSNCASSW
jgi:hypothetical protein